MGVCSLYSSKSTDCSADCRFLPQGVFFVSFIELSVIPKVSSAILLTWVVYEVKISSGLGVKLFVGPSLKSRWH